MNASVRRRQAVVIEAAARWANEVLGRLNWNQTQASVGETLSLYLQRMLA